VNEETAMPEPSDLPIYDDREAIRFASTWTGLPPDLVESVLCAKFRYLELAGLTDCVEDPEGLARERGRYRHLMPKVPGTTDERMLLYVAKVTRIPQEAVVRADQGDWAYMDSLALVEWDDEEDREDHVGEPLPPPGSRGDEDDPGGEAAPMHETHNDHWGAVVSDQEGLRREFKALRPGPEHLRYCVPSRESGWEAVTAWAIPRGPSLATWGLDGDDAGVGKLINAFPVAIDGACHPLTLHRTRVWRGQSEAIVEAATSFGFGLAYFDTAFLHPWNTWDRDEEVRVQLAGFAYALEPAPPTPIGVQTQGLAWLLPMADGNPDEFEFQGPATAVAAPEAWGGTFYRLEVTVLRDTTGPEPVPFAIPVYAAAHNLSQGYLPRTGDQVRGRLWLQGCPEGLPFPYALT
jgi:hypothetical protein